jgi:hypothetical protein
MIKFVNSLVSACILISQLDVILDAALLYVVIMTHSYCTQMRQKYKRQRTEGGSREATTLSKLASFSSKLKQAVHKSPSTAASAADDSRAAGDSAQASAKDESYHGQVTEGLLYEGEDSGDEGIRAFAGKLQFRKHIDDAYRNGATGADGRSASDYTMIDPRKQQQQQQQQSKHTGGSSARR